MYQNPGRMGRGIFALAGSPPSRAAISNRLFSLKHFNPARGIQCEQALPHPSFRLTRPTNNSKIRVVRRTCQPKARMWKSLLTLYPPSGVEVFEREEAVGDGRPAGWRAGQRENASSHGTWILVYFSSSG